MHAYESWIIVISLFPSMINRSAEDKAGIFYLFATGMSGFIITATEEDNVLGPYTEVNFEKVDGQCTFDLGVDLTCPLIDDHDHDDDDEAITDDDGHDDDGPPPPPASENCGFTVKAVKLGDNTIELEFPGFGTRLAVKN